MTPINLPYLQIYAVSGKRFAYYRRNGKRIRLKAELGSPAFVEEYELARAKIESAPSTPERITQIVLPKTIAALVELYKKSPEYLALGQGSRKRYASILQTIVDRYGNGPVASIPRSWVIARRDELQETPAAANYMLAVIRRLMSFAVDREWRADNPALRIKNLKGGDGHRVWTDAEITLMTSSAAKEVRLPVLIALFTAQRQGDILKMLWSAYDGQTITVRQSKTGAAVIVPVHPVLKRALDSEPRNAAVICLARSGKGWKIDHFKHRFSAIRAELGLPDDMHFHGLRHQAAVALAEAGCSDAEIQSITGHKTRAMVGKYTSQARQKMLAKTAMERMEKFSAG